MSIRFNAADHSYWLDDRRLPSVTQILRPLSDFSMVDPSVLKAKQMLGTAVHLACELHDVDDLGMVDKEIVGYVDAWRRFRDEKHVQIVCIEQVVHQPLHGYAGTLDRVAQFDDSPWILDIKTSDTLYASVGPQLAAYLHAHADTPFAPNWRRGAVQLKSNGTYKLTEYTDLNDWPTFLSCLTVHKFLERYK